MTSYEKLGAFYLGKLFDGESQSIRDELLLYDAVDLTTHAVCVGMTGSGKTGLCLSLLEEAAIDGIPALAVDPKGDVGNLLLSFPELQATDFRPWIDTAEAARKGHSPDDYASKVAARWRQGLADWGQDGERIRRFRQAADLAIYTPGSSAGLGITPLGSLAAPPPALLEDLDAFRERVAATVSGLLALLGMEADPIRSREHILLSTLLQEAWKDGKSPDLADLVAGIQRPPLKKVGVMDLETFFPSPERLELAMAVNNLLASPGFAAWTEGEPLEIPRLLWTAEGKPRVAILSIAHLSDPERMFFVTLLLNELVAWMRTQAGSSSLRALLYMDEVFGYFPPTANPPSKLPMLTLLKQARAYGIGVVLATQNPVDLDYKGLSNAGTWFLGRLQTERDKERVLAGLEGASAATGGHFNRRRLEATLAGLQSRVFLMNNVHEDEPVLFHTRWALSYLRGPLTRAQIETLMAARRASPEVPAAAPTAPPAPTAPAAAASLADERPVLPSDVPELFLAERTAPSSDAESVYRPFLLGTARLHFARAAVNVDQWQTVSLLAPLVEGGLENPWEHAEELTNGEPDLNNDADPGARFLALPTQAAQAKSYRRWSRALVEYLYRTRSFTVWKYRELKQVSSPGESEGEFRVRLRQLVRERRDLEMAELRQRYAPKLARLQERIRRAETKVSREKSQYDQQKLQTAISVGATVLGALFGRKLASVGSVGRATTAARGVGRSARELGDLARAREELEVQRQKLSLLEQELQEELMQVQRSEDLSAAELEAIEIRPRKSDISVGRCTLVWSP